MVIVAWLVILAIAWFLTKKFGFESLLIFTAPIHRIFFDLGVAVKSYYIIVLLAVLLALVRKQSSAFPLKKDVTFKLIIAFVVSIFIATLLNGANVVSFRHIGVLAFVLTGAYLIYRKITTIDDMRRMTKIYLSVGLFLGITGLAFYGVYYISPELCVEGSLFDGVTVDLERYWAWPMLQSVDVGSNGYAMTLIPFLFVSLGLVLSAKELKTRLYAVVVFLLLFINLFLTFSRGGMVAFFLVAAVIILLSSRSRVVKLLYVMFLLFSFPLVYQYAGDLYVTYSTMKGAYSGAGSDLMSSRGELFFSSLDVFFANPVFGIGQGIIIDPRYVGKQSHNTYIELLAENGVGTFLLFIMVLVSLSRKMLYIHKQAHINKQYYFCMPFLFGMIGLMVAAIPTSAITMTLLWIHIAVILAFYNVIKSESENNSRIPLKSA